MVDDALADTGTPLGFRPDATDGFVRVRRFTSSGVVTYVPVQFMDSPGPSTSFGHCGGLGRSGSDTETLDRVTLPVFLTEYR